MRLRKVQVIEFGNEATWSTRRAERAPGTHFSWATCGETKVAPERLELQQRPKKQQKLNLCVSEPHFNCSPLMTRGTSWLDGGCKRKIPVLWGWLHGDRPNTERTAEGQATQGRGIFFYRLLNAAAIIKHQQAARGHIYVLDFNIKV